MDAEKIFICDCLRRIIDIEIEKINFIRLINETHHLAITR